MIERIIGQTWDAALRERLFTPLGLSHTVTLPEEALMFRAAVGHLGEGDTVPQPAPIWGMPRSAGPAGLITATAADVLEFAAMHLTGGVASDGTRVLAERAAKTMARHHFDVPDPYVLGDWAPRRCREFGWPRARSDFGADVSRILTRPDNMLDLSEILNT